MKLKKIRKLVIDRRVWLRGEGANESYLLRSRDHKMCCVGIYLEACGVPKSELPGRRVAIEVVPARIHWLGLPGAEEIYAVNDGRFEPKKREHELAALFKKYGKVLVEFVN